MSLYSNSLICQCFFTNNYFIKNLGLHVHFLNRSDFLTKNSEKLKQFSNEEVQIILSELEEECQRRRNVVKASRHRKEIIRLNYEPLLKNIYYLQDKMLAPEFLELTRLCKQNGTVLGDILSYMDPVPGAERVYRIPVFTAEFCEMFIKELKHFEFSGMPVGRPNTMNRHGILLEELGMDDDFLTPLREAYLTPISRLVYPELLGVSEQSGGSSACPGVLDSHRAFVVVYSSNDPDLDLHYDDAEVTLNVALNSDYSEGSLYFTPTPEMSRDEFIPCSHRATHGVLHRGQHRHGAMPIEESRLVSDASADSAREMERYNLIIWMRCSKIRNKHCPLCKEKPRLVRVEGTGAGFTDDCDNTGTGAGFTGDCDNTGTGAGFTGDIPRTERIPLITIETTKSDSGCTGDFEHVKFDESNSHHDGSEHVSEMQESVASQNDYLETVQVCNVL